MTRESFAMCKVLCKSSESATKTKEVFCLRDILEWAESAQDIFCVGRYVQAAGEDTQISIANEL